MKNHQRIAMTEPFGVYEVEQQLLEMMQPILERYVDTTGKKCSEVVMSEKFRGCHLEEEGTTPTEKYVIGDLKAWVDAERVAFHAKQ
jgi:hypothetical protein